MAKRKQPPTLYLKIRPDGPGQTTVWLCQQDGAVHSGLMYGTMTPPAADDLALALTEKGIRVEREKDGGLFAE